MRTRPSALAVACAALLLALAALPGAAEAATWYVNDTSLVGDSFTSAVGADSAIGTSAQPLRRIQMAIDSALAGDTIYVDAGTYNETVVINADSIALIGRDSAATVIDVNETSAAVGIFADTQVNLLIQDIGVKDAFNGIRFVDVDRSKVAGDSLSYCANIGLHLDQGSDTNLVTNVAARSNSTGIKIDYGSQNTVTQSDASNNGAGGIGVEFAGANGNLLERNTTNSNGNIGLLLANGAAQNIVRHNVSRDNGATGSEKAALSVWNSSGNMIAQNQFDSNVGYQVYLFGTSNGNVIEKGQVLAGLSFPDSGLINATTNVETAVRVWWGSTDSAAIKSRIGGAGLDSVVYIPYRLGIVDTAPNADTVAPKAPDTVAAQPLGGDTVRVSWSPVTLNEEPSPFPVNLAGYAIWTSDVPNTSVWELLGEVGAGALTFDDTGVMAGETVYYVVTAFDSWMPFRNESFYSDSQIGIGLPPLVDFTDSLYIGVAATYPTDDSAYLEVEDAGANLSPSAADTLLVTVTKPGVGNDTETVTLTEIGLDSDVFRAVLPIRSSPADSIPQNGKVYAVAGETLQVDYGAFFDTVGVVAGAPPVETPTVTIETTSAKTIDPWAGGETAVLAFRVGVSGPDTIVQVDVQFLRRYGPASPAGFAAVDLLVDSNLNGEFDPGVDTPLGPMSFDTPTGRWRRTGLSTFVGAAPDSVHLLVAVVADSNANEPVGGETVGGLVPTGGVQLASGGTGPIFPLISTYEHRIETSAFFKDPTFSTKADTYLSPDTANLLVHDFGWNVDSSLPDTVSVVVRNLTTNETEPMTLTEIYADSGTFTATLPISSNPADSVSGNVALYAAAGETLQVDYGTVSDTVLIVPPAGTVDAFAETGGPPTVPPGETDVLLLAFRVVNQSASPDTVTQVTVTYAGTASGDVPNVSLWADSNGNAVLDTAADVRMDSGTFAGNTITLNVTPPFQGLAPSGGLRRYFVSANVAGAAPAGDTLDAFLAVGDVANAGPDTVPSVVQNSPGFTTVAVDTTPPGPFILLGPAEGTETSVTSLVFGWTASTDSSPPVTYVIRRSTDAFATFVDSAVGANTTAVVSGLPANETTYWRVIAQDAAGNTTVAGDSTLLVDVVAPGTFTLLDPVDGHETSAGGGFVFAWNAAGETGSGINKYQFQISTSPTFATLYQNYSANTATTTFCVPVANETSYWRVIAVDDAGNTTASAAPFAVFVDTVSPVAGGLVGPTAGNTVVSPVLLDWNAGTDTATGVGQYRVQVATNAVFTAPLLDAVQPAPDTTVPLAVDTYWWRVFTIDDAGNTAASATESFLVVPPADTTPPGPFILLGPAEGTETSVTSLVFGWTASTDSSPPVTYVIRRSTDAFATFVDSAVGANTTAVVSGLPANETTYWRVIAQDAAGNTTVAGDSTLLVDLLPPGAFSLIAPPNGLDTGQTTPIAFSWGGATETGSGLFEYRVHLSTDPAFAPPYQNSSAGTTTALSLSPLANETTYWRVVAIDDVGNQTFSNETNVVRVDTAPPAPFTLASPASGANTSVGSLWVTWNPSSDSLSGLQQYRVQTSTNASFFPLYQDQQVAPNTTTAFITLLSDTSWWRVVALDTAGNQTISTDSRTIFRDAQGPSPFDRVAPAEGLVDSQATIAFRWTASTDTGGLASYRLQVATSALYSPAIVDTTLAPSDTEEIVALFGTASFSWRVIAQDATGNTTIAGLPMPDSTFQIDTAPPAPFTLLGPAGGSADSQTSVFFTWNGTSDTGAGLAQYRLRVATNAAFAPLLVDSPTGLSTSGTLNLAGSETYWWRVVAVDAAGNSTTAGDSIVLIDTIPPGGFDITAPGNLTETNASTVAFAWNPSGDGQSGLQAYRLQVSANASMSPLTWDSAVAPASTTGTLTIGNDTSYWRVVAVDAAGNTTASTSTFSIFVDAAGPAPFDLSAPADLVETGATAIAFSWTASSDSSGLNRYQFQVSTSNAFAVFVLDASNGLATNTTVTVPANDTYFWRVIAFDDAGNSTVTTTPFRQFLVDLTAPTAAGLVAPVAGNTVVSPVLLDWNASTDGLSGLAGYALQVDTAGTFAGPFVVNGFQATPDSTLAFAPDTYFWRVVAQDQVGNTAASATESFIVFVPAETLPPTPGALSAPASALETSATTILFTWTAATDSSLPITYTLRTSTSAVFATYQDSAVGTPTSAVATLSEATWYWKVIAQDANGNTAAYASSSFIVDITAPSIPTLVDPTAYETKTQNVLLDWNASTDAGAGVLRYRVQLATNAGFAPTLLDAFQATPDTTVTLTPDTYTWRVYAEDDVGNLSGFSAPETFIVVPPTDTIPPDPVQNLAAAAGTDGTITLTWDRSPSSDMTGGRYVVYWDSGTGNPTLVLASIPHSGTSYSYTTVVLQSGTTYSFLVRAEDASGNQNSDSTKVLATAQIVGATPVQAVLLDPVAGMSILKTTSGIFLYAEITPAAQASSVSSVRFDYRADTTNPSAPWSATQAADSLTYPNPAGAPNGFSFTYWDVGPIATGVYQVRAVANVGGVDDTAPPVVTITLTADTNTADRVDTLVAPGDAVVLPDGRTITATETGEIVQAEEVVYTNADNTVIIANETTTATIELPAGAVTGESTDLRTTIRSCNDTLQGRPNNLAGASMRVDVTLASGQTTFGGSLVTVTLSYPDSDQDGIVDGTTLPEDQIDLWVYSAANGWEKIEPVTRDPDANTVSGQTSHFSTFLLVGPGAAANMNNVTVTPNPYRPNDGNAATGLPFASGVVGTGIHFVNLPSQVRIEVFTITGRRVVSITSTASTGTIQWDAKNEDGRDVASGWYVYVVTDLATGERKTGKLAVIR